MVVSWKLVHNVAFEEDEDGVFKDQEIAKGFPISTTGSLAVVVKSTEHSRQLQA